MAFNFIADPPPLTEKPEDIINWAYRQFQRISDNLVAQPPLLLETTIPASASADGQPGEYAWDSNYLYLCTAKNTWRRIAHSTW